MSIFTGGAESLLSATKESFFNKTPRIVSPMDHHRPNKEQSVRNSVQVKGSQTTRNASPYNNRKSKADLVKETYERVMNDERRYDQITGPDRNKVRLEQSFKEAAEKGRALKVKHI